MSLLTIYVTFHSIGLVIWTGMAMLLPLVILPMLQAMDGAGQTTLMATLYRRYLPWFIISGLIVGATGWAQTIVLFNLLGGHPIIYLKHVAVVILVAVSAYIWFYLARKLSKPGANSAGLWKQMQVFSWLQLAVSAVVLFLCAWMLNG